MRRHDYAPRPAHIKWLLNSDPAIRWQVMSDLIDEAPDAIAAERSRVSTEGWGAQLLACPVSCWPLGRPRGSRTGTSLLVNSLVVLMDLVSTPSASGLAK